LFFAQENAVEKGLYHFVCHVGRPAKKSSS